MSLKDKEGITITNAFQKILDESNCNPNKICVDKGSEFYKRLMKSWLEKNAIEMYSTQNEGKFVVAERFIITLKNKIYEYITSISKNVCIDKSDDIGNKYSNTYHDTIKINPLVVKSNTHINSSKKLMIKMLNLKLMILLEYQNIKTLLQIAVFQIGLKKFLVVLKENKLLDRFTKKNCKENEKGFIAEKVIKKKGDKLYVKWKGYNNSFNRWIDKKDSINE